MYRHLKLPEDIGLFCKRALEKRRYSAKETYSFKEPTNCSHSIPSSEMIARLMLYVEFTSKLTSENLDYGVATISRFLKIIGLFCRI